MIIDRIDLKSDVLIVAEIGNNHEGDFGLAAEMIHVAAAAGAQAVKFQTILPERLVSASQQARIEQLAKYAFNRDQFAELAAIAQRNEVTFLSTPFSPDVVPWLDELAPAFKIASGDNNYESLLQAVGATGKPILLSTGMAGLAEIEHACQLIEKAAADHGKQADIALLHCVSAYPTPPEQANLMAIQTLARTFAKIVGYSDHTLGIDAAVLSVALGARIIEKHFTLSKTQSDFRDHALSADPKEMAELVSKVRLAQTLLGNGVKIPQAAEMPTAAAARRSIVARAPLAEGHLLTGDDLDWLRPGGGLAPGQESLIIGQRLSRAVNRGDMITQDMVR